MAVEAAGFVLREHQDAAQVAVDAVGQGKVDDAIEPAEGNGRLCPVARERIEPCALAAGQYQREDVFHSSFLLVESVVRVILTAPMRQGKQKAGTACGTPR